MLLAEAVNTGDAGLLVAIVTILGLLIERLAKAYRDKKDIDIAERKAQVEIKKTEAEIDREDREADERNDKARDGMVADELRSQLEREREHAAKESTRLQSELNLAYRQHATVMAMVYADHTKCQVEVSRLTNKNQEQDRQISQLTERVTNLENELERERHERTTPP